MSALHRLKAYFGMVPAGDFDPAEFDLAELDAAQFGSSEFSDHHVDYRSSDDYRSTDSDPGYGSDPGHGSARPNYGHPRHHATKRPGAHRRASDGYDDGLAVPGGRPVGTRAHPARPPSWATESWATKAPVRGSLAIDTAATPRQSMSHEPMSRRATASSSSTPMPSTGSIAEEPLTEDGVHPLARIVTLHPHNYNEARPIGERYREGNPVIMNLTEMQDRDAKRLVDFAAGLAFALRGSIDKITNKVFLLSPPNVDVSPEDRRLLAEGRLFD